MLTSYVICQLAADYIETHGWFQGSFLDLNGRDYIPGKMYPACAVGACKYASGYYSALDRGRTLAACEAGDDAWNAARAAWLASPESESESFDSFHKYNDAPDTTKEDVIRILRNCPKD